MNSTGQNAAFALFCHDTDEWRDHLLESWFVERLAKFAMLTKKKKYAQECFLACSREEDLCPFILLNLTFVHFSNFLSTRTRR
jgi:hypothetical protein